MVKQEEPYKSFQIYRPVLETPAFLQFHKRVEVIGQLVLGTPDGVTIQLDESDPDFITEYELAESVAEFQQTRTYRLNPHKMYDSEHVKLTLFDRRSPVTGASPLTRLYNHFTRPQPVSVARNRRSPASAQPSVPQQAMKDWQRDLRQAALRHDIADADILRVRMDKLAVIPNPGYEARGWEFSLLPDTSTREGLLLVEEASLSHGVIAAINQNIAYPTGRPQIEAAFTRLPANTPDELIHEFYERVAKLLPITAEVGGIKVDI